MCGSANTFEWHEELDSHYEDDPEVFQGYKKVTNYAVHRGTVEEAKQHGRPRLRDPDSDSKETLGVLGLAVVYIVLMGPAFLLFPQLYSLPGPAERDHTYDDYAAVRHASDRELVTPLYPAKGGERILIYGVRDGLLKIGQLYLERKQLSVGQEQPPPESRIPVSETRMSPSVAIGGVELDVPFVHEVPETYQIYEIGAQVPVDVEPGEVVVNVFPKCSGCGYKMAVKGVMDDVALEPDRPGESLPSATRPPRLRIEGTDLLERIIHKTSPTYPHLARQAGIEGTVSMELVVDVQGTVDTVKVLSGHPLLVPQAIQAVKEWTFEPVLYEGDNNPIVGVCTSLPTTPHLVVGRSACRVGVGPSLNRSWAQRSRPVVQAGRRAFPR